MRDSRLKHQTPTQSLFESFQAILSESFLSHLYRTFYPSPRRVALKKEQPKCWPSWKSVGSSNRERRETGDSLGTLMFKLLPNLFLITLALEASCWFVCHWTRAAIFSMFIGRLASGVPETENLVAKPTSQQSRKAVEQLASRKITGSFSFQPKFRYLLDLDTLLASIRLVGHQTLVEWCAFCSLALSLSLSLSLSRLKCAPGNVW